MLFFTKKSVIYHIRKNGMYIRNWYKHPLDNWKQFCTGKTVLKNQLVQQ